MSLTNKRRRKKEEYSAAIRQFTIVFLFSSFEKEQSTILLRCQDWILDKRIWPSRGSVFYFCVDCSAINSKVHTEIV